MYCFFSAFERIECITLFQYLQQYLLYSLKPHSPVVCYYKLVLYIY